eukprot:scaffold10385_cov69-Attheya_sp.AAC.1
MSSLDNSPPEEEAWSIPLVEPTIHHVPPPPRPLIANKDDGTAVETTITAHRPTTETQCDSQKRVTATDISTTTTTTTTGGTIMIKPMTRPLRSPVALSLVTACHDSTTEDDRSSSRSSRRRRNMMIRLPATLGRRELLRLCWASSSSSSCDLVQKKQRKQELSEAAKFLSRHNMIRMDAHNFLHIRNSGTNAHAIHLNGQLCQSSIRSSNHNTHPPLLIHSGDLLSIVISPLHTTLSFRFITTPTTPAPPTSISNGYNNDTTMSHEHETSCSDEGHRIDTTSRVSIDTGITTLPTRTSHRSTQKRKRLRTTTVPSDKGEEERMTHHIMDTTPTRTNTNVADVVSNPHEDDCDDDEQDDDGAMQEKHVPSAIIASEGYSPLLSMHHFSNPNHDDHDDDDATQAPGSRSICAGEEEDALLLTCQDDTMWTTTHANEKLTPSHPNNTVSSCSPIPVSCLHRSQLIHHLQQQQQQQQQQQTSSILSISHERTFREALLSILSMTPQHQTETSSDNIQIIAERPLPALLQGTLLHR